MLTVSQNSRADRKNGVKKVLLLPLTLFQRNFWLDASHVAQRGCQRLQQQDNLEYEERLLDCVINNNKYL